MKRMRVISHGVPLSLCLLLVIPGLEGCGDRGNREPESVAAAPDSIIHLPSSALTEGEVQIATVAAWPLADTVVVNGQVQAKPLNLAHASARVTGTIESVSAVIGDRVSKGQVLATLYSPEFSAAEGDYLLAHERAEGAQAASSGELAGLESIARSARQRLELLGANADDLARLDRTHLAIPNLPLRSPISGVVTEVEAAVGRQVPAGSDLFGIANLREVWAVVDAYERDLGRLHVNQRAAITATAFPGIAFAGRVVSLEGSIKEATRTLDVRLELLNAGLKLKPGMFVTARIATGVIRDAIVLDEGAVQSEAGEQLVYVALTDSTFVPRHVVVRSLGGNRTEVVSGLRAGERIAIKGAFILRSQASKSQLGEE